MTAQNQSAELPPFKRRDAVVVGFGLLVAALLAGGTLGIINAWRLATDIRWVAHTQEVMASAQSVLSLLIDVETGQRGYLLTEDTKYLEPYESGLKQVHDQFAHLKQLTSDNPSQQSRLESLRGQMDLRLEESTRSVELMKKGDRAGAIEIIRSDRGKALMDDLRRRIDEVQQEENDLLRKRADESEGSFLTTVISIVVSMILGILLVGAVAFISNRNISERQRAAEILAEQKEHLRMTLASIGDAVISTDEAGQITNLNAVAEKITGWKNAEALGRPLEQVFRIVNETTRQAVESPTVRVLTEGIIVGLANHTVLIAKDGAERPIDDSAAPIRCREGKIVGCVLVFRDVTEKRSAAIRLERSEQRLRFVMDSMPQKIFTAKPGGEIDSVNAQWSEFTGLSFEEIRDGGWQRFLHPDDVGDNAKIWQRSIQTGEPFEFEHRFRRVDGEFRWHISRVRPFKNAHGAVQAWVGSNTDIHEQVLTANELRELAARLSKADRLKNEFLAVLAHELRNPLAPIRNGLELLRKSGGNAETVEQTRTMMERQFAQMVRLVDDLMDINRVTGGKLQLRKERLPLADVVNIAVEASRPLIDEMGHRLTVALPDQPVMIEVDPIRLAQVLSNLLANAAKYSDKGGQIRLSALPEDGDLIVSVKDTGIGIEPNQLTYVFEMFTQIHRSIERSSGGLGIGLTLVQRLAEMHGGKVEAKSEGLGKGSEFVVRLPVVYNGAEPPAPVESKSHAAGKTAVRVLIVDDNRDNADSLSMMLQMMGNTTRTAYDGEEALLAADEFQPQVVLLDIGLPKLNGYEVCRRLRNRPGGKDMVIIAQTGWGQEDDRRRTSEAGFNSHLVKPVDPSALIQQLAAVPSSAKSQ